MPANHRFCGGGVHLRCIVRARPSSFGVVDLGPVDQRRMRVRPQVLDGGVAEPRCRFRDRGAVLPFVKVPQRRPAVPQIVRAHRGNARRLTRPRESRSETVGPEPGEHLALEVAVLMRHRVRDSLEHVLGHRHPSRSVLSSPTRL